MSAAHEKAAWVFVPPEAALENTHTESNAADKRLANITAKLHLAGHEVHRLEHGYLVCRWGQTRVCNNLAELVGFARQIGAHHD